MVARPLPLSQKYRPSRFRDVIGQDVFVSVLTKALVQQRVSHGVLLTGIRGVGKTTLARLLAKALCCEQLDAHGEPCQQCPSCVAVQGDHHVDIVEMDAASHTGVDDMRVILDSCPYQPLMGKHKVYILDEVHMLSKSAFNALLKTLEEPPSHVTFVFATTDVAKVPLTIVSRCQQLHLHRIQETVLSQYLQDVAGKEGYTMDPGAVTLIAKVSEGGVRDALVLLERVLIVANKQDIVTPRLVEELVGLPPQDRIQTLLRYVVDQQPDQAIADLRALYHQGCDPIHILQDLLHEVHALCVHAWQPHAATGAKSSVSWPDGLHLERLDQWWQLGHKGLAEMHTSPFPLLSLEMLVLRMMYAMKLPTPSQLLPLLEPLKTPGDGAPASVPPTSSAPGLSPIGGVSPPDRSIKTVEKEQDKEGAVAVAPPLSKPRSINALQDVLDLLHRHREVLLHAQISNYVSWVGSNHHEITLHWDRQRGPMPAGFATALESAIKKATDGFVGRVLWSDDPISLSPMAQAEQIQQQRHQLAQSDPTIQSAMAAFPGLTIEDIKPL